VRVIFVNVFAGINRCDWIATGVVQATRTQGIGVPIVVRLAGTNVDEGRAILEDSGLAFVIADDLDDGARKAAAAAAALEAGYDGVPVALSGAPA
jgi:malate-CoA ligase subunit beta